MSPLRLNLWLIRHAAYLRAKLLILVGIYLLLDR